MLFRSGKDYFLVEVNISPDDKILVEIDHKEGVWIEDCVELSRYIDSRLNREEDDYELEIGSADIHKYKNSKNLIKVPFAYSLLFLSKTTRNTKTNTHKYT